jgi:hypothetical protein
MRDKTSKGFDPSIPLQNEYQVSAGSEFTQQLEQRPWTESMNPAGEILQPSDRNFVVR